MKEEPFCVHDIYVADECFVTGTGAEVIPVVNLDGRLIGGGRPGRITLELLEDYRKLVMATRTPIGERTTGPTKNRAYTQEHK